VVGHVRRSNSLRKGDLELLEELLQVASGQGAQAAKARFWSLATVKRLLFTSGKMLALGAAHNVVEGVTESSILLGRLKKLLLDGESAVVAFAADLPSTSREALLSLIERLRGEF